MTRPADARRAQTQPSGANASRPPRARDPYGLLPAGTPVAALLAAVGLLLAGLVTFNLLNGQLPFITGNQGGNGGVNGAPAVGRTAAPSNVVVVPTAEPVKQTPGTLVYAKAGNIWIQRGTDARQLTDAGTDSMPSISPDGAHVYFVRTRPESGRWPVQGRERFFRMDIPTLMRIPLGGGEPEALLDGEVSTNGNKWFGWIRQPVVRPGDRMVALASDLPDPTESNVTMRFFDLENQRLSPLDVPEVVPLGHQDPEWRWDGKVLVYVKNDRNGATGAPEIWSYVVESKRARALTGPGYLAPSYSRDSRWIAATKTTAFGTDIVILDNRGDEVRQVTDDGRSWSPVWSPMGDAIAYLHSEGQIVDLRMTPLEGDPLTGTLGEPVELTSGAGLDGSSRPDWFIPEGELPPLPTPRPSASPAASASAAP